MEQLHLWWFAAFCLLAILSVGNNTPSSISVTLIENAVEKGAVCLDGSPGGYYFDSGSGDGATKYIVYLKGGGWCNDTASCLDRSKSDLGSSTFATPIPSFAETLMSSDQIVNSDFYNWNRVNIVYCDGASFMADVEEVDPETKLYQRGGRIFMAVMEELTLTKGMKSATEAILAGHSAGGLATILNCDRFRSYLPLPCKIKCLSDSGFFIHAPEIPGAVDRVNYFSNITTFHNLEKLLPQSCTSRLAPSLCLFPEYVVDNIETPLFLLNSAFDQYQLRINVVPNPDDYQGWAKCTEYFENVTTCTPRQLQLIIDFGKVFMNTLEALDDRTSRGLFINSCYIHDFAYRPSFWQGYPVLENKTIAEAFADWYFERSTNVQLVDTEYPYPINCDTTATANLNFHTIKNVCDAYPPNLDPTRGFISLSSFLGIGTVIFFSSLFILFRSMHPNN